MAAAQRRVLVYGGSGALGKTCVKYFKEKNWWVGSVDLTSNDQADVSLAVIPNDSWIEQADQVATEVGAILSGDRLDALICVAGGWAGGNASSKDFIKNCDLMWKQSVWTSTIAAQVASKHLKEGGLLALTGAKPALDATPGMIGYGMAKAAVHHLVKSLSSKAGGLPQGATALAVLPITLDTPMNRKFMPDADHSTWTPLDYVSELLFKWSDNDSRPSSGSLIQLVTKNNETNLVTV